MESIAGLIDLSVLIVEADLQTRETLFVFFRILGCATTVVRNAAEASAAIQEQRFDLIIADYWLPDGDGASVLQSSIARQEGALRILTTAYPSDMCPIKGDLTGIDEVVHKPFTGCELRNLIGRHAFVRTARSNAAEMQLHR